jgi:two-component sensor histidine kinase
MLFQAAAHERDAAPRIHLELRAGPDAPADARASLPRQRGMLSPACLQVVGLVLSELVTNAVMHGRGAVEVLLEPLRGGGVRGHVADQGDGTVALRPRADDTGGMGLRLVDAVARWGVHAPPTRVWFEVPGP